MTGPTKREMSEKTLSPAAKPRPISDLYERLIHRRLDAYAFCRAQLDSIFPPRNDDRPP
jgi:hypothetical protein